MLAGVVRHGARGAREDAVDEGGRMDPGVPQAHCCSADPANCRHGPSVPHRFDGRQPAPFIVNISGPPTTFAQGKDSHVPRKAPERLDKDRRASSDFHFSDWARVLSLGSTMMKDGRPNRTLPYPPAMDRWIINLGKSLAPEYWKCGVSRHLV
jgi:hypothetical protein